MKTLVATATYNEANNIREFVTRVRSSMGVLQDILVVDDDSPDGTSAIVNEIKRTDRAVHLITRPVKSGLGSAHKLMKIYAMAHHYEYLVTMDADLSHRPEEIPLLLESAGPNVFVIGSRYAPGGKCDYVGFRNVISTTGNVIARMFLGIDLNEFTTSFRVFDVRLLERTPLYRLKSNGYSYFMEVVSMMDELGARLVEVPIHFKDRENDVSKIPKSQAVKSLYNLMALAVRRRFKPLKAISPETRYEQCRVCREFALLPKWQDENVSAPAQVSSNDFKCSSVQNENRKPLLKECLCCGLIQSAALAPELPVGDLYGAADDSTYLANFAVKMRTFRNAYKKIAPYLPGKRLHVLDVGSYYGAFLEVLKAEGHTGCGVEPSRAAAQYSRDILGHDVLNELFSGTSQFPERSFDVITAWDVIEHLEDPVAFLAEINKLLKNDGLFVVSTIVIDSLIARMLKNRWHWIIPMHLTYFRKREIIALLEMQGFKVLDYLNHTHYASLAYAVRGMGMNMSPLLHKICQVIARMIPGSIVIPVALGDVRTLICRKVIPADYCQTADCGRETGR